MNTKLKHTSIRQNNTQQHANAFFPRKINRNYNLYSTLNNTRNTKRDSPKCPKEALRKITPPTLDSIHNSPTYSCSCSLFCRFVHTKHRVCTSGISNKEKNRFEGVKARVLATLKRSIIKLSKKKNREWMLSLSYAIVQFGLCMGEKRKWIKASPFLRLLFCLCFLFLLYFSGNCFSCEKSDDAKGMKYTYNTQAQSN